jgi:hypothetical protein
MNGSQFAREYNPAVLGNSQSPDLRCAITQQKNSQKCFFFDFRLHKQQPCQSIQKETSFFYYGLPIMDTRRFLMSGMCAAHPFMPRAPWR